MERFSSRGIQALGTPAADIEIDCQLVGRLLRSQHPDIARLPIRPLDAGWDNAMFRLGDSLAVRLPKRRAAAELIEHEQLWLPQLADRLSLPVPNPNRVGKPSADYPWNWSVLPWIEGVAADLAESVGQAERFALFLRSLHTPAPANAPANPFRDCPLATKATDLATRFHRLETATDLVAPAIKEIFARAVLAPVDIEQTWIHGDLHPRNILIDRKEISGIIDWGDVTAGDAATDLAAVWMLFASKSDRAKALTHYGNLSTATLHRAKGWAVFFAIILLDTGIIDNPRHAAIGRKTLRHLTEDAE